MEDIRRRFGFAVRKRRERLGFSQERFAEVADIHRTYMGGVERGERNVSLVNIEKIARGFKIPLATLFRGV